MVKLFALKGLSRVSSFKGLTNRIVKDMEIAKIFYDVKCLVISCRLPIFVEKARRGCIYT